MPPRPFSQFVSNASGWSWEGDGLLKRPEHAAYVAAAIGAWSNAEAGLVRLLATILSRSARSAVVMLDALPSFPRRAALVRRVARIELPAEEAELVDAVLTLVAPHASIRNDFAHHLWTTSPEIDDGLVLVPPEVSRDLHADIAEFSGRLPFEHAPPVPPLHTDRIPVYQLADLKEAHAGMNSAALLISDLEACLGLRDGRPAVVELRARFLQKFRRRPDIAAEIASRAARNARRSGGSSARPATPSV